MEISEEMLLVMREQVAMLQCLRKAATSIDDKLRVLRDAQAKKDASFEFRLMQGMVIPANSDKMSESVNNPGYNRCRIEVATQFSPGASAGVEVSMIYGNSPIAKISDIISSNGSSVYKSEPVDVNHFSGFQFQFMNRDLANSVTLTNMKIILYND
jgi:hypothetical protein